MSNNLIKTIARVGYAPITSDSESGYTYGDIGYFESGEAGGREISATAEGETIEIYADGKAVISGEDNNGYTIDLTLLSNIDDIEKDWLGNTVESAGVHETADTDVRPRFALVAAKELLKGEKEYQVDIFYNCQVTQRPDIKAKTKEKSFDPLFPTYKIAARPRTDNKWIRSTIYCDELPTTIPTPPTESGTSQSSSGSGSNSGSSGSGSSSSGQG